MDELYKQYMQDVHRYLLYLTGDHYAAEDLLQETFYRAYLYLESYDGEKVKPWLLRVAHNAFVDYKRKERRSKPFASIFFRNIRAPAKHSPESVLLRIEELGELGLAVASLPENQRQAVLLYDYQGLSYQEAADIMDIGLAYFKVLLFRARQQLRKLRERGEDDER
ncbi:sigma-70 family RNA polymerase sigma factor [Paenibacillus sp. YIM B09110]|uniref:sigma-70 family RNA polymerase sigma factor n=1 Tax=Paenibacillus sp. YIM B09110 TaxID=3126102 RepID=UPI00301DFE01